MRKIFDQKLLLIIVSLLMIFIISIISFIVFMRLTSLNFFTMNIPNKIPKGFKRISIVKKIPPEKDWYFIATYENAKKQQIIFHYEPRRNIRCGQDPWKKDLSVFRPTGSSEGCSFYLEHLKNNKTARLHWFLWKKDNATYSMYDQESVLTGREVIGMAESIKPEKVIAKDLTNKK